jgi:murein DD-endopeptidase MepM/ murein hydrolase activator NlpD
MKGLLLFVLGALCGASVMYFLMVPRWPMPVVDRTVVIAPAAEAIAPVSAATAASPPPVATTPAPIASPVTIPIASSASETMPVVPESSASPNQVAPALPSPQALLIPVDGVRADQLSDTFDDARSAGRRHDAIDIMAPKGTRVLAVADGVVTKLFTSVRGGLTVYQFDPSVTFAYYYAHLDSYAPGLLEGKQVRRGDLIGYVGSSGDASPTAPHLHFAIMVLGPEKHWWQGTAINPYPILSGRQSMPVE